MTTVKPFNIKCQATYLSTKVDNYGKTKHYFRIETKQNKFEEVEDDYDDHRMPWFNGDDGSMIMTCKAKPSDGPMDQGTQYLCEFLLKKYNISSKNLMGFTCDLVNVFPSS